MPTSQDFVKGIDITAQTSVSGSELNQLIDVARTAVDKGLTIVTTDTSLNVPEVPNPDVVLEGVTPTWWKNYIWIRRPFDSTGNVVSYAWNPTKLADPIFLQWQSVTVDLELILLTIEGVQAQVVAAQADLAELDSAVTVNTNNITQNTSDVSLLNTSIGTIQNLINLLCPSGTLRWSATSTTNGLWLLCDGTSYERIAYPNLFAAIGTTYGSVDSTHFNVPDALGRTLFNSGNGSGLSTIALGQKGGANTHLLTGNESGIQAHTHPTNEVPYNATVPLVPGGVNLGHNVDVPPPENYTGSTGPEDALEAHSIMPPFIGALLFIKT